MNPKSLSLHIGKNPEDDSLWICLVDSDGSDIWPLAQFVDETRMKCFTLWMNGQGFDSIDIPQEDELAKFFEDNK